MMKSKFKTRLGRSAIAASAAIFLSLTMAGTANAAEDDGKLEDTEFGLYYNSDRGGCVFDLTIGDGDFKDNYFKSSSILLNCNGKGLGVNNNTASYWNRTHGNYYVYSGAGGAGTEGVIPSGYAGNASPAFKNAISSAANPLLRDIWKS
ncbi:peptidase inhibitor family I36 protein [Streptomyces sp. NPDC059578]|uniref:peptidase inhibitor family I36 protein n=1 Tax=Streptomyces sp. NPDC059578 TaxID=3346874 RepID=UPI003698F0B6